MTIYLDIETVDLFQDPHIKTLPRSQQLQALRFGLATTLDGDSGEWQTWYAEDLMKMWNFLIQANTNVVGWNLINFDLPVIEANLKSLFDYAANLDSISCYDIFDDIRSRTDRWYKLDVIAQANLGYAKSADGKQAANWIRSGNPDLLKKAAEYCRDDVQLTYEIHQILLRGDALTLPARRERRERGDLEFRL